jgi:hypothetical protein
MPSPMEPLERNVAASATSSPLLETLATSRATLFQATVDFLPPDGHDRARAPDRCEEVSPSQDKLYGHHVRRYYEGPGRSPALCNRCRTLSKQITVVSLGIARPARSLAAAKGGIRRGG